MESDFLIINVFKTTLSFFLVNAIFTAINVCQNKPPLMKYYKLKNEKYTRNKIFS